MDTRTLLLASILTTTGLVGVYAAPGSTAPALDEGDPLTREDLQENRITYSATEPDWSSLRLTLTPELWDTSQWTGPLHTASIELTVAIDPGPDASPYMILGVLARPDDPFPIIAPIALPADRPLVDHVAITIGCNSDCPDAPPATELAFLLGDMQATSTLHLAMPDGDLPDDPTAALAEIEARPALPIGPDHTGTGGFAGTYAAEHGPNGTTVQGPHGAIEVTEHELAGDLGHEIEIRGGYEMASSGLGSVFAGSLEDTSVKAWDWTAQLAEHRLHPVGAFASGPAGTLPAPLPEDPSAGVPPGIVMQVRTGSGSAVLDLDTILAPQENGESLTLVTWGWSSADLATLYGWPFQDLTVTSSPVDLGPADQAKPGTSVCTGLLGPKTCLRPFTG